MDYGFGLRIWCIWMQFVFLQFWKGFWGLMEGFVALKAYVSNLYDYLSYKLYCRIWFI